MRTTTACGDTLDAAAAAMLRGWLCQHPPRLNLLWHDSSSNSQQQQHATAAPVHHCPCHHSSSTTLVATVLDICCLLMKTGSAAVGVVFVCLFVSVCILFVPSQQVNWKLCVDTMCIIVAVRRSLSLVVTDGD